MFREDVYDKAMTVLDWLDNSGHRMPLVRPRPWAPERTIEAEATLFSTGRSPQGALAGLLLYLGEWERAHETAQDLHTPEGSYWHAIVHRQEPDAWNSKYWFRQTGRHPVFDNLLEKANTLAHETPEAGFPRMNRWDPDAFVDFCNSAETGSTRESLAIEIQHWEWKMLFDFCRTR